HSPITLTGAMDLLNHTRDFDRGFESFGRSHLTGALNAFLLLRKVDGRLASHGTIIDLGLFRLSKLPVRVGDVGSVDIADRARPAVAHDQLEFSLQNFDYAIDARLAESAEPPQEWPADSYRFGAECERFEHVRTAAETAVNENRN